MLEDHPCAVDSDCVCGGKDLRSGKCYFGNKAYYDVNVDKTVDCSCGELIAKCVKNTCTLVSPIDPAVAANPTACFVNLKEGTCCVGGICKTAVNDCTQGLTYRFLGCSDTCTLITECVGASGAISKPTATDKPTTTTNCVTEGNSYLVAATTVSGSPAINCCEGLVSATSPELVGRATCVKKTTLSSTSTCIVKEGICCIGNICSEKSASGCYDDSTMKFLGCTDDCVPRFECVSTTTLNCVAEGNSYLLAATPTRTCCEGLVPYTRPDNIGGATCVKPGTTSGDKLIVSTTSNPTITSVNNCPTPATPLCTEGKVIGVFKNDNGCSIFKCVDVSGNNPTGTAAAFPAICFDESLNRQVLEINKRLGETKDDAQIADLKTKLENINAEILKKKDECAQKKQYKQEQQYVTTTAQAVPRGVAVGKVCEVSENLRVKQDNAWKVYKEVIEKGDNKAITSAKIDLETIRIEIQSVRQACMDTVVPGQIKKEEEQEKITECKIPQELYTKLESLWKNARESNTGTDGIFDPILPADVQKAINEAEGKIRDYKAKCNAPTVTTTTNSQDLADGYKERIASAISSTDGTEAKIQSLKELRKEIDETIKNLIKEQKKFKFNEFKDLTDDVTISPGSVEIGDSKTESKDVEIETEIEGDNITVSTSSSFVLLEDSGLSVEASSVDISSDGITVNGTTLKVSPKKLLTKSKGLEQYKEDAKVKIEKIKGKVQYRAEYQSQKKLFGFIPVTANNAVEVDAVSGEITSKESPWWNGLATDAVPVKTEAIAEVATG
jgi:hypothetical protein